MIFGQPVAKANHYEIGKGTDGLSRIINNPSIQQEGKRLPVYAYANEIDGGDCKSICSKILEQ